MDVISCIATYFKNVKIGYPVFTDDLFAYVSRYVSDLKKPVFNEYVVRFLKKNPTVKRFSKGIYYKSVETPFGYNEINFAELLKRICLVEGDKVMGYETGPSYMNKIGLTTQVPRQTYIVTNRNRVRFFDENDNVFLISPIIEINNKNYRYLQFLDLLNNKFKVNIEANNAKEIYRHYIDTHNLNFETLLAYARYYGSTKLLQSIAGLAKES